MKANRIRVKSSRLKSVHWSRSVGRIRRNTFATSLVSSGAELLAAALDRFLVFGIFTNLAIIKDKVIKMFSRNKLLGRSWKRLFLNKKVSHSHEKKCRFLLPVKLLLFKKTDTFFYRSTRYLLDTQVPLISLRSKFYFSLFLDMKIWASRIDRWDVFL